MHAVVQTTMHFHTHLSWYLDNTFCGGLHQTYRSFDIETCLTVILMLLWLVGFCLLARQIFRVVKAARKALATKGMDFWDGFEASHHPQSCTARPTSKFMW